MGKKENTSLNFQNAGTLLAILISISALMVSIYEANLLKAEQRAMVWPYLTVQHSFNGKGFSLIATNNGTGPALVKSMEMSLNDTLIADYNQLLDMAKPDRQIGYDYVRMSALNQTVMRAGESREIFFMPWTDETRAMAYKIARVNVSVGYCSVLEDCWFFEKKTNNHKKSKFTSKLEFKP